MKILKYLFFILGLVIVFKWWVIMMSIVVGHYEYENFIGINIALLVYLVTVLVVRDL